MIKGEKIHIPLEEARNYVQDALRQQLLSLNNVDTELGQCVMQIRSLVMQLASSSQGYNRLEYYKRQFVYTGTESEYTSYLKLKIPRGKNSKTRTLLNSLQIEIYRFINLFMQRPMTTYVLYYKDTDGSVHRYDVGDKTTEALINTIYSSKKNRTIALSAQVKDLIQNEENNLVVNEHFNEYLQALEKAVSRSRSLSKSQKTHNMGHAAEAFERHWQRIIHSNTEVVSYGQDWGDNKQLLKDYRESKGNTAWWRAGDVGSRQVKWLSSSQAVSSGSFTSIQELANYILYLSSLPSLSESELDLLAQSITQAFMGSNAKEIVDNYGDNTLDKMLATLYR